MRTILSTIALFPSAGSVRRSMYPPTDANSRAANSSPIPRPRPPEAADGGDNRYFTRLVEWNLNENRFSTNFTVPFAWANRQVLLHIGQASGEYELRINDREAAYVADGNAPAEFNITKLIHEGRNTVEIRVVQPSPLGSARKLEGESRTDARRHLAPEPAHAAHPRRDDQNPDRRNGDATAEVALVIKSEALNPRTSRIHYQLLTPTGENAAAGHKGYYPGDAR